MAQAGPELGGGIYPTGRVSHHGCDGLSRCLARCRTSISYFWRHARKLSVHQSCMAVLGPRRRKKGAVNDVDKNPIVIGLKFVLTFLAVLAGWILFRAASLSDAVAVINAMVGGNGLRLPELPLPLPAVWRASWLPLELAALFLALWLLPNTQVTFRQISSEY